MIKEKKITAPTFLSASDLRDMAATASTIAERLNGDFLADDSSASEELRRQRFNMWCHIAAAGNRERFREVLSWDGYDTAKVRRLLGYVRLREHSPLPGWTKILQEVLCLIETLPCTQGVVDKGSWGFLHPDQPYPFEELLAPFVVVAQQHAARQAGSAYRLLADEAHYTLQRHLLQVLTSLSLNTLHAAFLRQTSQDQASSGEPAVQQPVDESAAYRQFTVWMYQGELAMLLHSHSFLARLLASTTARWIESYVEFLHRLEGDWLDIQHTFGGDPEQEQVIAIEPALSDPHHGRRSVMALTFVSGKKLVYKPRNIGIEVHYYQFLAWCNEHGATPPLKVLTSIDRTTYGWIEYIEHEASQDAQATLRYYRRAGMLLCLVYVLGGTGCSYEHIIAHGEYPVLIDPTILLHHYPCSDHQDEPLQEQCSDWEQEQFSVLHTGLLASWQTNMNAAQLTPGKDSNGFAMHDTSATADQKRSQAQPQSPCLALRYGMLRTRARLNVPITNDGNHLPPAERYEALCAGFTELYQFLLSKRDTLLAPDGPLHLLGRQAVRVSYRANQDYHAHLAKCLEPEYMHDGVARNIELERLWQEPVPVEYKRWREGNSARWRQVYRAEQQALLQGDLPFFTARADSDVLFADRAIASCLHQPSFDLLLKRVAQLSESDLRRQVRLIRQALSTDVPSLMRGVTRDKQADNDASTGEMPSADALLAPARAIADAIADLAISLDNQAVTWLQPQFLLRSQRRQLQPVRYNTYNGACGIALFLAAFAKITGEARYGTLARAALRPLCRSLREDREGLAREMGIGGAVGLGSVIYALTSISRFLDDPAFLIAAKEAAHLLRTEYIGRDQALDVIAGSAGTILGLLALYDATRDQNVLDRASACGNHLLQTRTMSKAGCLAWPTLGQTHTTGFSHGTAGIMYALSRLYSITGDHRLLHAAREGLAYEDQAFVSKAGNWAETLNDEEPAFTYMATWCHGAPGIGLARIGGLPGLDSARIQQDIEIALQTTQRVSIAGPDHLCCGNSGRAEILLEAARKLARPELAGVARRLVSRMVSRAEQNGNFSLDASLPRQVPLIGLFQGSSGIGYTLLRMAYPDMVPSVLLWEC